MGVEVVWSVLCGCPVECRMCWVLLIVFFSLISITCSSKRILLFDVDKMPKNPAYNFFATLTCRLPCAYRACVIDFFK